MVVCFIILIGFLLGGRVILKLFGMDIDALGMGGGIFIFGMG
ncbi:MarC family protein [Bacillus pumilus]